MLIKECSFCESPSVGVDENGFCKVCREAFEILTSDEIEAIQKKVGFEKRSPDNDRVIIGRV